LTSPSHLLVGNRPDYVIEAHTPLGFSVRVTRAYWTIISTIKHPVMAGCEAEVQAVLETPEEIRRGKSDPKVCLFYRSRRLRRWVCAVSKQEGRTGFLITAYPADTIKEGEKIWPM
jgi:hypothetical protein